MDCTIRIAKTKALISFAVTAKLICAFVFAYVKTRFSHVKAHCCKGFEGIKSVMIVCLLGHCLSITFHKQNDRLFIVFLFV